MTNRGWEAPVGEVYGAHETANGELGFYVVADGSLINYQVMAKLLEGHMLADGVAILGSLNIVAGELDR